MGAVGLITYMRTDSLRISDEARAGRGRSYIGETYGKQYLPPVQAGCIKSKANAQDAHEAIRPTMTGADPGPGEGQPDRRPV